MAIRSTISPTTPPSPTHDPPEHHHRHHFHHHHQHGIPTTHFTIIFIIPTISILLLVLALVIFVVFRKSKSTKHIVTNTGTNGNIPNTELAKFSAITTAATHNFSPGMYPLQFYQFLRIIRKLCKSSRWVFLNFVVFLGF